MAKKRLTTQDRLALDSWNELVASVREHSDINPTDTETEIRQRRERLEKNDGKHSINSPFHSKNVILLL